MTKETELSYVITSDGIPSSINMNYSGWDRTIYDVYKDTPSRLLSRKGYIFRERRVLQDNSVIYGIKGPKVNNTRLEIEDKDYANIMTELVERIPEIWGCMVEKTQERLTLRRVYPFDGAEMDVDHTWIDYNASYWNIEIEGEDIDRINWVKAKTIDKYIGVREWPHSKYATGVAIKALGITGELSEAKFDAVDQYIKRCM